MREALTPIRPRRTEPGPPFLTFQLLEVLRGG
jgi:hypothetical protein